MSKGARTITWQHVLRKANQVVDALAKVGLTLDIQFKIYDVPPSFISNVLRADAFYTWFPRA